ncbi:MAG TPA: hypothetical protein VIY07_17575, partial [Pseudolabrys sp.]
MEFSVTNDSNELEKQQVRAGDAGPTGPVAYTKIAIAGNSTNGFLVSAPYSEIPVKWCCYQSTSKGVLPVGLPLASRVI